MENKPVEAQELFIVVGSVWELTKGSGSVDFDAPASGMWDPQPDEGAGIVSVEFF